MEGKLSLRKSPRHVMVSPWGHMKQIGQESEWLKSFECIPFRMNHSRQQMFVCGSMQNQEAKTTVVTHKGKCGPFPVLGVECGPISAANLSPPPGISGWPCGCFV